MNKKRLFIFKQALALFMVLCSVWGWGQVTTFFNFSGTSGYLAPPATGWESTGAEGGGYLKLSPGSVTSPVYDPATGLVFKYDIGSFGSGTTTDTKLVILDSSNQILQQFTLTTTTGGSTYTKNQTVNVGTILTKFKIKIEGIGDGKNVRGTRLQNYSLVGTVTPSGPVLTATPTSLSSFTYIEGNGPSSPQSFKVSGSNLTADLTATAPANYEISKTLGSGYADNLSFTPTSGAVAETTVYSRLKAGLVPNSYSGNLVLSSTSATSVTVELSGTVSPMPVKPVISAPTEQTGTVGVTYNYQIVASGSPSSYAIASGALPAGLNLNTATGVISGTPTSAGMSSVSVTATNAGGISDPAIIQFNIAKGVQTAILNDINATVGSSPITLPATTSAGLTIVYAGGNPEVATVSGNILTIVGVGSTTITATVDETTNYSSFDDEFGVNVSIAPVSILEFEFEGISGDEQSYETASHVAAIQSSTISRGAGLTPSQNSDRFNATNWATTSIANAVSGNDYMEFTITPAIGYQFNVSKIFFQIQRSGTGLSGIALRSSVDNYTADLDGVKTVADITSTQSFTFNFEQQNSALPVTYRLYGYAEATSGSAGIGDGSGSDIVVTGQISANAAIAVWNGTAWSNTTGPDATTPAIIDGDYEGAAITAQSLTVNAGKTLTVNNYVSVGNVTNNGNILVADGANFVQTGTFTAGAGSSFKVRKDTKPVKRLAYINWSSPMAVSTQTLKDFSYGKNPDGSNQSATGTVDNRFFTYNNNTFVSISPTTTFQAGAGYQIRTPNDFTTTPQVFHGQFEGTVPNSGPLSYDHNGIIMGDYVLLGNPYPSAISISDFLTHNPGTQGTFYIWNSGAEMIDNAYGGGNYNTYAPNTGSVPAGSINGYIPVGQGFFIKRAAAIAPFVFTNAMRQTTEDGVFSKAATADKFWLELTAPTGSKPQMLIGFNAAATLGYDAGFDAALFGTNADALYSEVNGTKLVIDAHGTFSSDDTFALKADLSAAGNYTIGILKSEGVFASGQQIWLKDQLTGTTALISEQPYAFSADAGTLSNRFVLQFKPGGALATDSAVKSDINIYSAGSEVHAKSSENITSLHVYDMSGRMIAKAPAAQKEIVLNVAYKGVVLVKAQLANGTVKTTKLMLK